MNLIDPFLIKGLQAEMAKLRRPWRAVDAQDWQYINSVIPDGGRGRFWKQVLAEMRVALGAEETRR